MSSPQKDTIYIDIDDEITALVDKVQSSSSKIVALVLPKRAVVLQSIVNMKLLKRAVDEAGKRVVLITSDSSLLPIAGAVGVYTAKNLQSKPEIPPPPEGDGANELLENEESIEEPSLNSDKTVGELADNQEVFESDIPSGRNKQIDKPTKTKKPKKDKKNKVPNFDSFRKKVFIAIGIFIVVSGLLYYAFFVSPKAVIAIQTETNNSNQTIDFKISPAIQQTDFDSSIILSKEAQVKKSESTKTPATGQKDLGSKASGSITMSIPCSSVSGSPPTVPGGTGISSGGLTFITQSSSSLTTPSFGGSCKFTGTVNVVASENGEQYNLGANKSFDVAGFTSVSASNSSAFTGGSSRIVKVVSSQDIDIAKKKLTDQTEQAKNELKKQLEDDGYFVINETFSVVSDNITVSPQADQEAEEVTVVSEKTFSMSGVKKNDIEELVKRSVEDEMKDKKMQIQDSGIDQAVFRSGERSADGSVAISMQLQVVLGPKIADDNLKEKIAGKKRGDVENIIKEIDGVKSVEVRYSPFWVSKTPKNINKITINYEKNSE